MCLSSCASQLAYGVSLFYPLQIGPMNTMAWILKVTNNWIQFQVKIYFLLEKYLDVQE